MIVDKPKSAGIISIDLSGPDGNAFNLISLAKVLGKEQGKDTDSIVSRMKSGDYENLLQVLDQEFGDLVILYR